MEGVLYHTYPGDWQVWKALDGESEYERIANFDEKPGTSEITNAFSRYRAQRDQRRLQEYNRENSSSLPLPMLLSSAALGVAGTAWYLTKNGILHF